MAGVEGEDKGDDSKKQGTRLDICYTASTYNNGSIYQIYV